MKPTLLLALAAIAAAVGCNSPQQTAGNTKLNLPNVGGSLQNIQLGSPKPPTDPNKLIDLTLHQVQDDQVVAYTYVMPKGWLPQDKIQWTGGKLPYPIVSLVVKSPDLSRRLAVFPMVGGNSWSGRYGSGGMSYESASDAIDKTMLQNTTVSNYTSVQEKTEPAKSIWQPIGNDRQVAEVCVKRCEFIQDGIEKEALIVAKLDTDITTTPDSESKLWHLGMRFMSAPKGQLTTDSQFLRQAATFFTSASITPQYNQMVNKIAFDASQINRREAQQEDDRIMKSYWDQQKGMERGMKQFDDYIRGVQGFKDPKGGPNRDLPSGSRYWQDADGNMRGSTDPDYNPNDDGGNWTPMEPVPG